MKTQKFLFEGHFGANGLNIFTIKFGTNDEIAYICTENYKNSSNGKEKRPLYGK